MEHNNKEIKSLYMKRIEMYRDLLSCIKRERENLMSQDINGIWNILEEKNNILCSIKEMNDRIVALRGEKEVTENLSDEEKKTFINLSATFTLLKDEIGARIRENNLFIRETLGFINDIFSTLAKGSEREANYGRFQGRQNESANLLYHNEA